VGGWRYRIVNAGQYAICPRGNLHGLRRNPSHASDTGNAAQRLKQGAAKPSRLAELLGAYHRSVKMESRQQIERWLEQASEASDGAKADMDVAKRLITHGLEALDEIDELHDLLDRMEDILRRTAIALRGPEPELTRWSWHDLPERAAAAIAAIDVMQRAAIMAAED